VTSLYVAGTLSAKSAKGGITGKKYCNHYFFSIGIISLILFEGCAWISLRKASTNEVLLALLAAKTTAKFRKFSEIRGLQRKEQGHRPQKWMVSL
jgi:hypothetical protein